MKNLKYILASFIFLSPLLAFGYTCNGGNTMYIRSVGEVGNTYNLFQTNFGCDMYQFNAGDVIEITGFSGGLITNNGIYTVALDPTFNNRLEVIETIPVYGSLGSPDSELVIFSDYVPPPPPVATGLFSFRNLNGDISTSPADLVASVGVVSGDTFGGALPYMLLVIGVGVAFYLIQNLKQVIPADKKGKKRYDITTEKSKDGTYHASFKETKQK